MNAWLRVLLHVKGREIPSGAVTSFEFANLPHGAAALLLLLLLAGVVAGIAWIYKREGSAPAWAKVVLGVLRALTVLVAVLLLLEPVLAVNRVERVEKSTILLLDDSLSMTTKDRYLDPVVRAKLRNAFQVDPRTLDRADLVSSALAHTRLLQALSRQNAVRVFTFNDAPSPVASVPRDTSGNAAVPPPPLDPAHDPRAGRGTNFAAAIRDAVESVGAEKTAAVILVSDGRATLGPPAQDVALYLENKGLDLYTVSVGENRPPRNLRAVALAGPDRIFRNDPVSFTARISGQGFDAATVVFERRYANGGTWQPIGDPRTVAFPPEPRPVDLEYKDKPTKTGRVEYRIRIEPDPAESTTRDNAKTFATRVVDEKVKVLLVSGAPSYEYRAVKNVLLRDGTIVLACYLQSADPEFAQDGNGISLRQIPGDQKQLYAFDVVLLDDPDPSQLPPAFGKLLEKFVGDAGGGLGYIAGNKYTLNLFRPSTGDAKNPFVDLMPVVLDLDRADQPGSGIGFGAIFDKPWRMVPDPEGLTHPATRFRTDPDRAKDLVWDRLPPFYWFFPVLKSKPGAVVLARHEDPRESVPGYGRRPILAVQRYGSGNVLFLATDSTHRWRSAAEPVFDRFWIQSVRFLMEGKLHGPKRRFRAYLDRETVDLGDAITIRVEAFDENYKPFSADALHAVVKGPGGKEDEIVLLPVPNQPGHYSASYSPAETGDYEIRPKDEEFVAGKKDDLPAATFRAVLPDREMGDVRSDRALLADLAARTGGKAFDLPDLGELADPARIPPGSERVLTRGRPIALWDTWLTVVVLLTLLCAEWILRKRFRMV